MTEPERHLTAADAVFLREHSGVREATPRELAALAERSAARDDFELAHALTLPVVATLLGVSEHAVPGMTEAGLLYSYTLVPDAPPVVAAIPAGSHPTGIRTVMTSPSPDLLATASPGVPLSPADWLSGGGSPEPVLSLLTAYSGAI